MYEPLENALGYKFQRMELLEQALTHRSHAASTGSPNNERLEFLGDAVLQLVVSTHLYKKFPHLPEGQLAKIRALLVSQPTLADLGRRLKLDTFLKVGKGEELTGVRQRDSVLCDVVEAVYGAIFLDGGLRRSARHLEPPSRMGSRPAAYYRCENHPAGALPTAHTKTPTHTLAGEEGPPHNKQFTVEVWFEDELLGRGFGRSKRSCSSSSTSSIGQSRSHLGLWEKSVPALGLRPQLHSRGTLWPVRGSMMLPSLIRKPRWYLPAPAKRTQQLVSPEVPWIISTSPCNSQGLKLWSPTCTA